ncbi:MAG: HAD family phosphatase [Flavobacteriales bacterium]|jgi:glucose-1-phosphatase|nr:HAD family phosphatase [Flavobacteriales bacterium]|tara:strand:+ start:3911 stop:4531 length:621 start_codon:yes stop_codon:yes gene_type:complete
MKKIEHIVFDLGNVILNIDYQKTIEEFNKLGISNASSLYSQSSQSSIFDLLETGNISDQKFILEIKKLCQKTTSKEIIKAWNAILLEIPNERILLLNKLKTNFNIFLLSNTNSIHIKELIYKLGVKKYNEFYSIFKKVYYSHEIGLRKPNPEIFKLIIKENNLKIQNILFIDDSIQHIESAKKIGILTHHLLKHETIETIFPDIVQ